MMALGNPIEIAEYDPRWLGEFEALRQVLAGALGELAIAIEHVGSTAVVRLAAKPIIDIDVVIEAGRLPEVVEALAGLGYEHQGDLGIAGREAFRRLGPEVPRGGSGRVWVEHHLYVCGQDNRELRRHVALRDYLRGHSEEAVAYGRLKRELAERFRFDREAYGRGKSEFIEGVLGKIRG